MAENQLKEINEKIDIIVNLLALNLVKDAKNQKDKIINLYSFGFTPSQIAKLLGTTPNTVSVAVSEIKKKGKQDQQAKEEPSKPKTNSTSVNQGEKEGTNQCLRRKSFLKPQNYFEKF